MKAILENIDSKEPLLAYTYKKDNFDVPMHFHPEYELVYIKKGKGNRFVGDKVEPFDSGDLVLIAPNIPHCWRNIEGSTSYCESLVVQWKSSLVDHHPELKELHHLLNDSKRGLQIEKSPQILQLIYNTIHNNGINQYIQFLSLLNEINSTQKRFICSSVNPRKITETTSKRLNATITYIENHFQERIRLLEVAYLVGLSESAFSRFFSRSMRKTFISYLNEYRIQQVCKMLQEQDISVSEACFACGFESLPYFHRQFLKFKKLTPLQYKKEYTQSYTMD